MVCFAWACCRRQVDWGLALPWRAAHNGAERGVPAFAANRVFSVDRMAVHPVMDLASIAYTWVAIVYGRGRAPWEDELSRTTWLTQHEEDPAVKYVLEYLKAVYDSHGTSSVQAGLYEWRRITPVRCAGPRLAGQARWRPALGPGWGEAGPDMALRLKL
jgi:hypothetical protein